MTSAILQAVLWLGGLAVAAVLVLAAMQTAHWAALKALALAVYAINYTVYLIRVTAQRLSLAVQAAIAVLLEAAWAALRKSLVALARAARTWLTQVVARLRGCRRARAGGARNNREEPRGERDERRAGSGAHEQQPPPPRSAYDEALELLGLQAANPLTREALKERVREIMSRVHPDKGFPNHVFAQQINAAAQTVKKVRGWR